MFVALFTANLALIFTNLSWTQSIVDVWHGSNRALWWVSGSALVFLMMAIYLPFIQEVFHFSALSPPDIAICLAILGVAIVLFAWDRIPADVVALGVMLAVIATGAVTYTIAGEGIEPSTSRL